MSKKSSKTDLKRLSEMSDEDINFTDIPETDDSFWASAEVVMPKKKKSISIRLDEDVIEYFKGQGKGYQSRMNAVLKSYINHAHH